MTADIAFVVPATNVDWLLREALASILDTSIAPVELCVVLDGYSGEVPTWLKASGTLVSLPSRSGSATARNAGFAATSAPLVAVMDADDVALPGRADRMLEHFAQNPGADLVGGSSLRIDHEGRVLDRVPAYSGDDLPRELLKRNLFVHSTVTLRRSSIAQYGEYDPRCMRMQDYELMLRWASRGAQFDSISSCVAGYRVHAGQVSRKRLGYPYSFSAIRKGRLSLAKRLGMPVAYAEALHWGWVTWQWAYSLGLRDLDFDRAGRQQQGTLR